MTSLYILFFIAYIVFLFAAFTYGRRWRTNRETKKLIQDLEKYFGEPLPSYKKQKDQVNWDLVLKMLRKESTTDEVARLKELVKKRV